MSTIDNVLKHNTPTVQDMSNLVLDNARSTGVAMDIQDRQLYTAPQPESVVNNCDASSSSNVGPPIAATTSNEFAAFSTRSSNLGRMTSEQALDYFLDQHNARSSQ